MKLADVLQWDEGERWIRPRAGTQDLRVWNVLLGQTFEPGDMVVYEVLDRRIVVLGSVDEIFSALAHDHDDSYASLAHDHDAEYTPLAHASNTNNPHQVTAEQIGRSYILLDAQILGAGGDFTVPVPPGYQTLKLHMHGHLDAVDHVRVRVNNDSSAGLHRTARLVWDGNGTLIDNAAGDITNWLVAQWGGVSVNNLELDILNTSGGLPTYQGRSNRVSNTLSGVNHYISWGRLNSTMAITSLRINLLSASFGSRSYRLYGVPV